MNRRGRRCGHYPADAVGAGGLRGCGTRAGAFFRLLRLPCLGPIPPFCLSLFTPRPLGQLGRIQDLADQRHDFRRCAWHYSSSRLRPASRPAPPARRDTSLSSWFGSLESPKSLAPTGLAVSTAGRNGGVGGSKPRAPGSRAGSHGTETNLGFWGFRCGWRGPSHGAAAAAGLRTRPCWARSS